MVCKTKNEKPKLLTNENVEKRKHTKNTDKA